MAKKKKKGLFGASDDLMQLGLGIVGAGIVTTGINKFSGGRKHGGGGGEDGGGDNPDNPMTKLSDYIGEISGRMGMPKPMIVKGIVGVGFVFAAEKMPQYRTAFLFIAGILIWDALTSHPRVREYMGINGVLAGTEELNQIEADLRDEISALKESMDGVLAGAYPGSPSVNGAVMAGASYPGSPAVNGIYGDDSSYNALGL
jgi:hypothetical protein